MASLCVPPPLEFRPRPLRTASEVQEATGRAVLWKTSDFRLTYTKRELRHFCAALAAGKERGKALRLAVTPERYRMIGGPMAKGVEAMRLAQLPEVKRAVESMRDKARKAMLMDMVERRGHCARIARRSSTPPNAVINAVMADAKLAKELDDRPVLDVTFNQVLASLSGTTGLPTDAERAAMAPAAREVVEIGGGAETGERAQDGGAGGGGGIHPLDAPARIVAEMEIDEGALDEEEDGPDVFGVEPD